MSTEKADLARAGTMQVTAKEGKAYLNKNLTEWKKPYLMDGEEAGSEDNADGDVEEEEEEMDSSPVKKPKLSKHTTMKGTAKEAAGLLGKNKPDEDALTRGQQKQLEKIQAEKAPPARKGKMGRVGTMHGTAKEGKALVGDKLGDTRAETKSKVKKGNVARSTTIDKVTAEAKLIYGDLPKSEGRSMRKRAAPPPAKAPMKKKGTMQKTASEGKAFLKRGRPKKAEKADKKEAEADNNEDAKSDGEA